MVQRKRKSWQTMMGWRHLKKEEWWKHDWEFQLFTRKKIEGQKKEHSIEAGERLFIYWPRHKVYMGVADAADKGPYLMANSHKHGERWNELIAGKHKRIKTLPYGIALKNHWYILNTTFGVPVSEIRARTGLGNNLPGGLGGLRETDDWPPEVLEWLEEEIRSKPQITRDMASD